MDANYLVHPFANFGLKSSIHAEELTYDFIPSIMKLQFVPPLLQYWTKT